MGAHQPRYRLGLPAGHVERVLVTRGLYDKQYVADNAVGFETSASLADCTPEWAEKITGIPATTIARLAVEFAEVPRRPSNPAGAARSAARTRTPARRRAQYACSTRCWAAGTRRAAPSSRPACLRAMWTRRSSPACRSPRTRLRRLRKEYPLALPAWASNLFAAEQAKNGVLEAGMFFYNSNMAAGYSNTAYLADALSQLDLIVVVDVQMSETALLADYVLPDTSYLERPAAGSSVAGAGRRGCATRCWRRCIPTRVRHQIFRSWPRRAAWASTSSSAWTSWPTLSSKPWAAAGSAEEDGHGRTSPKRSSPTASTPKWEDAHREGAVRQRVRRRAVAPSGVGRTGLSCPWRRTALDCGGKQAIHSHTQTANIEDLMQITKDYDPDARLDERRRGRSPGACRRRQVEVSNDPAHGSRARKGHAAHQPYGAVHAQPLRLLVARPA